MRGALLLLLLRTAAAAADLVTFALVPQVRVELNSPLVSGKPSREAGIVHVEAMSGGKPFDLSVTLEPFRKVSTAALTYL